MHCFNFVCTCCSLCNFVAFSHNEFTLTARVIARDTLPFVRYKISIFCVLTAKRRNGAGSFVSGRRNFVRCIDAMRNEQSRFAAYVRRTDVHEPLRLSMRCWKLQSSSVACVRVLCRVSRRVSRRAIRRLLGSLNRRTRIHSFDFFTSLFRNFIFVSIFVHLPPRKSAEKVHFHCTAQTSNKETIATAQV